MVKVIKVKDGLLAGTKFLDFESKYGLPVGTKVLKSTTDALNNTELLDTTYDFRGFVKHCLRQYRQECGLKATLALTGLRKSSYYRGMKSDKQRFDSTFNKYLHSLEGIETVFDCLHNIRSLSEKKD